MLDARILGTRDSETLWRRVCVHLKAKNRIMSTVREKLQFLDYTTAKVRLDIKCSFYIFIRTFEACQLNHTDIDVKGKSSEMF